MSITHNQDQQDDQQSYYEYCRYSNFLKKL